MSAVLHLFDEYRRRLSVECADDEPVLWFRNGQDHVSVQITPRLLLQLESATAEARKFLAMGETA